MSDQLDKRSAAFDDFDARTDAVLIAKVGHESEKVWVAKPRIAIFLAAMRHFRDALRERGWRVFYRALTAKSADWNGLTGKGTPGETFGKDGPGFLLAPRQFPPDATTREVLAMVSARFAKHPGKLEKFD